jgi:7,8-dihydropterin-6-yl-methyl-4-(beta-D-ribofuranosyl)aminobenzene 5'-phosphate synthase
MKVVNLVENTPGVEGLSALHGLSFYIETDRHRILFDAGPSEETVRNAEKLGIDLSSVDVAVLSHGHYDHSGGLAAFAAVNPSAPIYMQRSAAGEHYAFDGEDNGHRYIGIDGNLLKLSQIRLIDGDLCIDDEISLFTVKARKFPLPSTNNRILKKNDDGYVADDFVHEHSLYIRSGTSSALLSGCAHNGILNIMEEFIRRFGRENLPDVVISGFHLMRRDGYGARDTAEQDEIAHRLAGYPCVFHTCHCTGIEPYERMKQTMGDKLRYIRTGETLRI